MAKQRNKPIGECECAQKGCDLTAHVFRYRAAGKNPNDWARRWAGKLYSCCASGHKCTDQEYLLEHAKIWQPGEAKNDAAAPAVCESEPVTEALQESKQPAPVQPPAARVPAPVKQQTNRNRFWWWEWET